MSEAIVTWGIIIFAIVLFILYKRSNNKRKVKVDYSFGLADAKKVKQYILEGDFPLAEKVILNLSSDDLTQVVDYIGLEMKTHVLLDWEEESKNKNIPTLFLGAHYNHQAWIARSHQYASDLSEEQIDDFIELQGRSMYYLLSVKEGSSLIMAECYSRLIRGYMVENSLEDATLYFHKAIKINKTMVWPYIHYCESIEPKWGGNVELITKFISGLPDVPLIKHIVELKLLLDSYTASENYFGGSMDALKNKATIALHRIDKIETENPSGSIHRYILYNYLFALADELKVDQLKQKYAIKMNGYYTLYPFGIIR